MKLSRHFFTVTLLLVAITVYSQKVNTGMVVGMAEIEVTLEDNMTFEQFEQLFMDEYVPALTKSFPGMSFTLLKGDRGKRTGKYTELWTYESVEERNRWWPEAGKGSEETEEGFNKMQDIQDRMMKMITTTSWTDQIVL
jgi:hypothetical protein